jgi:hypothetical protein
MQQAPGPGLLAVFAELVQSGRGGPVADIGCGIGRVTAHYQCHSAFAQRERAQRGSVMSEDASLGMDVDPIMCRAPS